MPLNVSKLGKILKTLNRVNAPSVFNSTLPVKIEVKKELNPITYLIKLGNKEVETKSFVPLKVGAKYMAQIKELKSNIQITNLREFPKILETLEKVTIKTVDSQNKDEVIKHLLQTQNKNDFLFLTNVLIALQKKIYHLVINEKRKGLLQYKYKKNRLKFYACFSHLGEIEGEIYLHTLTIYSPYEATISLINAHKEELKDFEVITIKKDVKPLYEFTNTLLDLKA